MKVRSLSSVSGLIAALAISPVVLADQTPSGKDSMQSTETTQSETMPATESVDEASYVGRELVDLAGEPIGEVEDLLVSRTDGQLYAVVDVGGFLGIGAKEIALPVASLSVGDENVILMSQKDESELKSMPEIDRSEFTAYGGKAKKDHKDY